MNKPIIGISNSYYLENGKDMRYSVPREYIDAIIRAGGVPIILAMNEDEDVISKQMELVDGFVLIGGCDVNPLYYGKEPHPLLQETYTPRDTYEHLLLENATRLDKPILGICRGVQMMNVYYGGTLYQDNSLKGDVLKHSQSENKEYASHEITIKEGSFLYDIFGSKALVNSFHHQSCEAIAPGFEVVAYSSDGIVEAIEHKEKKIYGVQFHPEMMAIINKDMQKIFDTFVNKL